MHDSLSIISEVILLCLLLLNLVRSFISKDRSMVWSPLTTISLTYIYYVSIPFWGGLIDKYSINESLYNGYLFHIAALLSYIFILIGFRFSKKASFNRWNTLINKNNVGKYGIILFLIGIAGYSSVRGFHFYYAADLDEAEELATGGFVYYLMMMLDMLPFASVLLLIKLKEDWKKLWYLIPFWLIFVQFLIAGARWRIVVALLALLTAHHLYNRIKKINVFFLAGLAVIVFLGFSIMDFSRIRGYGINMETAKALRFEDIKGGSEENQSVYWFSVLSMNEIDQSGQRVLFQPIIASVLMPIPRFLFPKKPGAEYLHSIEDKVGASGGAAYLNFVESYYSFGWFGVIIFAWILGWLSRMFWDNYVNNRNSIGAITALGVFSGFCYVTISRGFLPATFTTFILAICLPFWIIALLKKIKV